MPQVTRWLPINCITVDRYVFTRVLSLVKHLEEGGTVPPIHVMKWSNTTHRGIHSGGYHILDGRHRMMAYKLLGKTHIEVRYGVPKETR